MIRYDTSVGHLEKTHQNDIIQKLWECALEETDGVECPRAGPPVAGCTHSQVSRTIHRSVGRQVCFCRGFTAVAWRPPWPADDGDPPLVHSVGRGEAKDPPVSERVISEEAHTLRVHLTIPENVHGVREKSAGPGRGTDGTPTPVPLLHRDHVDAR